AAVLVPEAAVPENLVVSSRNDFLEHEAHARHCVTRERGYELVGGFEYDNLAIRDERTAEMRRVRLQDHRILERRRELHHVVDGLGVERGRDLDSGLFGRGVLSSLVENPLDRVQ